MMKPTGTRRIGAPAPWATALAILALMLGGLLEASPVEDFTPGPPGEQVRQMPHRVVRDVGLTPRIGPPGTTVTLRARLLPALTPVQVAIGATRSGFEGLVLDQTSADGDLDGDVVVPGWARRDQAHRIIVFNLYFSDVLAESKIFHVTDEAGVVVRTGALADSGPGCPTLLGDDEERYRLIGAPAGLAAGDRLEIEGVLSESAEGCGEGVSLDLAIIDIR